jgi:hypothetical protein
MTETIITFEMAGCGAIEIELPDDAAQRYEALKAAELPCVVTDDICNEHGTVVGHWLHCDFEEEDDFVFPVMAELCIGNRYAAVLVLDPPSYVAFTHYYMEQRIASETRPAKPKRARKPKKTVRRRGTLTLVK